MYPVMGSRSFTFIISTFLLPLAEAAFLRFNSVVTGMQKTTCPVLSPVQTRVLKTVSGSTPTFIATVSPLKSFSSTSYETVSNLILCDSRIRMALVLLIIIME